MRHALLATILIVLVPLAADAKPKNRGKAKGKASVEFKKHLDKGTKAHKARKFDVALTELQAAYAIDPQPKLLFAIGQLQGKLDNCPDAVASYEKFLESTKDKQKQAVVKQAIEACDQKIAATPAAEPPSGPEDMVVTPPSEPSPVEPVEPPAVEDNPLPPMQPAITVSAGKPWYKDALGDALVLSGLAAGVASIVMYTGARASLDDAENAPTLAQYQDAVDSASDKRLFSVIFAGGGAVLIGAGILRYKLRDNGEASGVAIAPASGGGLITWTGGF